MKKINLPYFSVLFLVFVWCNARSNNYYFSTLSGDDSRTFLQAENPSTPWKTISKFNAIFNQLQPGDTIFFKRGEQFSGGLIINKSGILNNAIVISAYGSGTNPVINGFVTVTQWTYLGNGIYQSNQLSTGPLVNMVVVNGINYAKGRFPNATTPNGGYLDIDNVSGNTISSNQLGASPDFDGGQVVIRARHWILEKPTIANHAGDQIQYSGSLSYGPLKGYGFFIQDHPGTLDQFGEWYYNPSSKKLQMFFGSQGPGGSIVQISSIDDLVLVTANFIDLQNLTFVGANRCAITNSSQNIDHLSIVNCDIQYAGIDAIFFHSAFNFTLEGCSITNTNNVALKLFYCPNTTIRNSEIRNTGMQPGMGTGGDGNYAAVLSEASGFQAEYNRIVNTGYIALRFGNGDNLIKNNLIDTFCAVLDDGAGIYTYASDGAIANRIITGNIVLNGLGASDGTPATIVAAAEGIYIDDNAKNIQVSDNTVSGCISNGIFIHNTQNITISDNTFYDNTTQCLLKSDGFGNALSGLSVTNNIYFSKNPGDGVFQVISDANNIMGIGNFDNNRYVRPFHNVLPIIAEYPNGAGTVLHNLMEISEWTSTFGYGQGSTKSPVEVSPYKINGLTSSNKLPNDGFDHDIIGTWCFSPYSDCATNWVSNSLLDAGCLKVSGPSPSRIGMFCGAVSNSKYYIVRFSAYANKNSSMEVFLMQDKTPWEIISATASVALSNQRKEYELLIANPTSEPLSTIQFQFGDENTIYWMDNIQMFEANISHTNPEDYIVFEFNATDSEKSVTLNGEYMDAHGNTFSDYVIIPPFRSVVLIKKECLATGAIICPQSECDYTLNPIPENTYYASNRLSSSGTVDASIPVEFLSGNQIELNPGFTIQPGASFEANISTCMIEIPALAMEP
jgi:parallel beta-helix repeat protein